MGVSKLQENPLFPSMESVDFAKQAYYQVTKLFRDVAVQVNDLSEGRITAKYNAGTAAPTTGKYERGDFIPNSEPSEAGTAGSKYVVTGWICTAGGEPGTWVATRSLTGN